MIDPCLYDPRDPEQIDTDPSTWKPTRNPALFMLDLERRSNYDLERPVSASHKELVSKAADYCEMMVTVKST